MSFVREAKPPHDVRRLRFGNASSGGRHFMETPLGHHVIAYALAQ
jgi:hypothetical protein